MCTNETEESNDINQRMLFLIESGRCENVQIIDMMNSLFTKCTTIIQIELALIFGSLAFITFYETIIQPLKSYQIGFFIISGIMGLASLSIFFITFYWPSFYSLMLTLDDERYDEVEEGSMVQLLQDQLNWMRVTENENFQEFDKLNTRYRIGAKFSMAFFISVAVSFIVLIAF